MSHIATIETEFRDLDALEAACRSLGLELRRGQATFAWWGTLGDRVSMTAEQLIAKLRRYDKTFRPPAGVDLDEWRRGACEHVIAISGDEYQIGLRKTSTGWGLVGDFDMFEKLGRVVGQRGGLLKQAYGIEIDKRIAARSAQLRGFRLAAETTLPNGTKQLRFVKS